MRPKPRPRLRPPAPSGARRLARRHPGALLALFLCSTGGALAALALPAALGHTVDRLVDGGAVPWAGLLLCAVLTLAETGFDAGAAVLTTSTGARLTFTRRTADAGADYQRAQSVIAHRLTEALDGADTIRAARTGAREYRRILEPLTTLAAHGRRTWTVYGRAAGQSALLLPLLMLLVLAVGGLRLQAGAIGVGDLVAASRYAALAVGIGSLTGALGALARSRAAARTLDPLLTLDPLPHEGLGPPHGGPGHLELRDVGVVQDGKRQDVQGGKQDGKQEDEQGGEALPDGEPDRKPLLTGVHLTVPGGTSLAVVGRSGSGKSVFAAVVGRLLDPDTGTVLLDGIPLTAMEPARLRPEIAYAFARPALPGTTVEDTIAFGPWTAGPAAVREGARAARADGFVGLLPYGYATPLTDAPLSGGERQRLGLARAFAHPGRLLILDDALSGLDTVTEHHVRRALDERAGRCTRVIVAHRLSSAARADQVLWLEDGRVRATGPHEELWADPEYRAVFRTETGEAEGMAEADEGSGAEGALPRARTEVEAR
ncbi:ATP-binding cassette domain-containing protein [Streptomyces rhizosphaericola]|uniref:ABC transporter ATP-binding protein n=1 Tax=Streptomyces rhizosphaericola TaxID=2564098 RepID=A0ABY2PBW4_9ACTN|nr:ABC transporter ATP-binding protein [Streptomyces rhizosphaericola]TGZ05769.1 ABC transporter ATP-binding protein [Streptomyces rhizosphaericola]